MVAEGASPGEPGRHPRGAAVARLLLRRRVSAVLLAVYGVAVVLVVFEPFPSAANGSVDVLYRLVHALGAPDWVGPGDVEFGLNIVLFAPLTLLGTLLFPRLTWEAWVGLALLVSGAIEYSQLILLPDRSATVTDLVANTLGGLLGALLGRWVLLRLRALAGGSPDWPPGGPPDRSGGGQG